MALGEEPGEYGGSELRICEEHRRHHRITGVSIKYSPTTNRPKHISH